MKQLFRFLLLFGLCILCSDAFARQFPNYPIPQRPDTLRILGIGNSFTEDGMEYLPDLLAAAGIENASPSEAVRWSGTAGNMPPIQITTRTANRRTTVGRPF